MSAKCKVTMVKVQTASDHLSDLGPASLCLRSKLDDVAGHDTNGTQLARKKRVV